ncbi:SDR family NAD(P)-dependent oxidoreductase [Haliangium ochraceum]|uniref:SDR family NAD(P)-dependent oxidoreductase n=1 Tax=Haliangium ochraceum TaxID=80816 RepID=UPI001E59C1B1|nr:SDR family oxidoreductase [Haliangium ochraceum]
MRVRRRRRGRRRRGRASAGAHRGSLYAACKAGILALSKSAAVEYAGHGVRVNALVPGAVDTPMLRAAFDAQDQLLGASGSGEAATVSRIPLARIGAPHEAGAVVAWLLSAASSYVTGHSLIADGGLSCLLR